MAEGLFIEFSGIGEAEYRAVNDKLGINMETGGGEWPAGLLMHTAAVTSAGTFAVAEVWRSQADQEVWMHGRLGEALAAAGVTAQPTIRWVSLLSFQTPNG
jgi:hypothetical protein